MGSMSIIEGNEFILRPLVKEDLQDFAKLVTNPLYGKFSPLGKITEEVAEKIVENIIGSYKTNYYEFWVVEDKTSHHLAGFVGYHPVIFEEQIQEMYFVGFYTRYWGSKFPEQAISYLCDHAFNKEAITRLIAFVHPDDTAALMCVQMLNARFEKETLFFGATLFLFSLDKQSFNRFASQTVLL